MAKSADRNKKLIRRKARTESKRGLVFNCGWIAPLLRFFTVSQDGSINRMWPEWKATNSQSNLLADYLINSTEHRRWKANGRSATQESPRHLGDPKFNCHIRNSPTMIPILSQESSPNAPILLSKDPSLACLCGLHLVCVCVSPTNNFSWNLVCIPKHPSPSQWRTP
jgi:hypothetical protein